MRRFWNIHVYWRKHQKKDLFTIVCERNNGNKELSNDKKEM